MDLKSFTQAIQQIADEKGIAKDKIIEAIEMALAAAYKRDYGERGQIIRVKLNSDSGKVTVKQIKIVVDETMIKSEEEIRQEEEERERRIAENPGAKEEREESPRGRRREEEELLPGEGGKKVRFNAEKHLMIEDAKKIQPDIKPGDELEFSLETHEEYGRIAAQTAKQVIIQRIREVEREAVFDEFKNKEGELVSGIIQRIEGRNVFVDIGRSVALLPPEEQIPYERYHSATRIKALVIVVEKNPKGPGIFLSRSHPRLLRKLFEIEVPEITSGAVEIKSVAREPGSRSKIAVTSHESGVDPVGSLVGQKGIRVSTVINELGGEKIDVIEWSEDPAEFIVNSLSPAKVIDVEIDERRKSAKVTVPDEQLSLAIGKGGQNVRLAAKLTGWKIDIRSSKGEEIAQSGEPDEIQGEGDEFKEGAAEEHATAEESKSSGEEPKKEEGEEKPKKKNKKKTKE